ncbi:MAG TPA: right-handed parallel beta-helix repeat-containing protein [Acidimicrobiales bacterium]
MVAVVLAFLAGSAGPAAAGTAPAGAAAPVLRLVAEPVAEAGRTATVWVVADGARDLAAFELAVTVDGRAAEVAAVSADAPGRHDLSVFDLDDRGVLAAWWEGGASTGTVVLGQARITPTVEGRVQVVAGAAELVDASGHRTEPRAASTWLTVGAGGRSYPAAAAAAPLRSSRQRGEPRLSDLNGDRRTDAMDLTTLAMRWEDGHVDGTSCTGEAAASDLDGDGCLTASDLQLVATSAEATTPPADPVAALSTFTVTSTADTSDRRFGDGICATTANVCTLRAAIQESNSTAGANVIGFDIAGTGPHVIHIASRLPIVSDTSGPTTIDGYTEPDASPNTDPVASNAVIRVAVEGDGSGNYDGLPVTSPGNTIRGLSIYGVRRPLWIYGTNAVGNVVVGNFVGTNPAATYVTPVLQLIGHGIHVEQDAPGTRIGGTAPADRNVISGNGRHGVGLWHNHTDGTVVQGNIVGLSPAGDRKVPNRKHGVDLNFGVSETIVGGIGPGEHNVISGNDDSGVEVSHTSLTTDNDVIGNYIGTDLTGRAIPGYSANLNIGVYMEDGVTDNVIEQNVIAGNAKGAVHILNGGENGVSTGNVIRDNHIGEAADGTPLPSPRAAIVITASGNTIGPGNRIVHHGGPGIRLIEAGALHNTFTANDMYDNGSIGIDLGPYGITANDVGDVDSGPNDLLNFPVVVTATTTTFSGTACANCTVELFVAATGTYRSGADYVTTTTADGSGSWSVANPGVAAGVSVTPTATDGLGNTSEFGAPKAVTTSRS